MAKRISGLTKIIEKFRIPVDMYLDECSYFSQSRNRLLVPVAVEHRVGVDLFGALFGEGAVCVADRFSGRSRAIEPASAATAGSKRLVWKSWFVTDGRDAGDPSPSGAEQCHHRLNDFRIDGIFIDYCDGNCDLGAATGVRASRDEFEFRNG